VFGGVVRGKVTTLRTPREDDLPFVNSWMADMRVRRWGQLWDQPAILATWKERLKEAAKDQHGILWTLEADGRPAGTVRIGLGRETPSVWVHHFVIDPERWQRGYGWDAALALHRYLFDYLDRTRSTLEVVADNAAALRIAERLGYRESGRGHEVYYRDGAYADDVWLRLDREGWEERWTSEREYEPLSEGIEG